MKIAAFDSGIGGLIAIAPIVRKKIPLEVSYLGDLANLPYGTKSPKRIQELTRENIKGFFELTQTHFDLLLLACNTASAHALTEAQQISLKQGTDCIGVIESGCQEAIRRIQNRNLKSRIVILGTSATIKSQAYPETLLSLGYKGEIVSVAAPLFVPLVESGFENSVAAEFAVDHYLKNTVQPGDTVILGCTHYPLLKGTLQNRFPEVSDWIEAGEALLNSKYFNQPLSRTSFTKSKLNIYLTDSTVDPKNIDSLFKKLEISDLVEWDLKTINPFV